MTDAATNHHAKWSTSEQIQPKGGRSFERNDKAPPALNGSLDLLSIRTTSTRKAAMRNPLGCFVLLLALAGCGTPDPLEGEGLANATTTTLAPTTTTLAP
ncbi:hypothetical protein OAM92_02415, partial [Acidimicrobiales bacterium]|nr:hypothetical protein [Acidimicrobiales bacterium]